MLVFIQLQEASDVPQFSHVEQMQAGQKAKQWEHLRFPTCRQCVTLGNVYAVIVKL